jgi:putative phage-type endonuclease
MTSFIYINDLEELNDIIDSLEIDNEESIFNEKDTLDLVESALYLMEKYIEENPSAVSEPDFQECFLEEIKELFYIQLEDHFWCFEYVEDTLDEILEDALYIFLNTFYSERSLSFDTNKYNTDIDIDNTNSKNNTNNIYQDEYFMKEKNIFVENQLNILRSKPQPDQRTDAWYKFRHNLITASNAYKAFESQSVINQLIYEKCQPLKTQDDSVKNTMVNVNTTLHWGQKYEPLSVLIYEHLYDTKVEDFGCIQHDTYSFLGASPDGINVKPGNERYGRMLEIKNIVNREITGIPKKEYWVQTQLQMEVCNLDECDFLETKFTEYENSTEFFNDGQEKTLKGEFKGVIMYFHTPDLKPFYLYKPLDITDYEEINYWEEEMVDKYQSPEFNMVWVKNCYWKLEKMSCVLVLRNKKWFQDNITQLEKVWRTIEEERITGCQHRAPNKKPKKEIQTPYVNENYPGCLLTNIFNVKKLENN